MQALGSLHKGNLVLINQLIHRGNGKAQHLRCFIDSQQIVFVLNIQSPGKFLANDCPDRSYDTVIREDMGGVRDIHRAKHQKLSSSNDGNLAIKTNPVQPPWGMNGV